MGYHGDWIPQVLGKDGHCYSTNMESTSSQSSAPIASIPVDPLRQLRADKQLGGVGLIGQPKDHHLRIPNSLTLLDP